MTTIEWTDRTWNPVTGCTKVSHGCKNCYAEKVFPRAYSRDQWPKGDGTFRARRFTDVECHPTRLDAPLHWRKPQRVFVNSMSDLFHEDVPDEFIDQVFAVMALCPQHTFQVLTKRPERMRHYMSGDRSGILEQVFEEAANRRGDVAGRVAQENAEARGWPLPNVWLGVSVEDQATADERIPLLLQTPAALRWVSYEPALGPVDFTRWTNKPWCPTHDFAGGFCIEDCGDWRRIDWIVVGGESGPGARPFDVQWARSTVEQCKAAGIACFVKQLGARSNWCAARLHADDTDYDDDFCDVHEAGEGGHCIWAGRQCFAMRDRKGGDPDEWPADLRVRQYPEVNG